MKAMKDTGQQLNQSISLTMCRYIHMEMNNIEQYVKQEI